MSAPTTPHDHDPPAPHAYTAVRRALDRASQDHTPLAVLLVDAEDVGRIDRAFGHAAGDQALATLEARLAGRAPADAALVRLTRERIVVLAAASREHDPVALAQALADAARDPLHVETVSLRLDATVGLALALAGGGDPAALLRDADAAAHLARLAGAPPWRLAGLGMHEQAVRRLRLEHELATALTNDELALYFQPIVSLRRAALVGVEALVRWRHPARGLIGPAQFLPVAEESGLIVDVGAWMLDAVCHELARWSTSHPERILPPVSLNVSGRELREETFAGRFADGLLAAQVPPEAITLEIADPSALHERADAEAALDALRRLGVRIVLDRFGGPGSSLAHLAQLPVDGLKLDRALLDVHAAPDGETTIARSVVALAHALGLAITVPGIETEHQLEVVRTLDADAAQGHLIARPAPATALADLDELERELGAGGHGATASAAREGGDELLPLSAVADALGVSPSTVRRLADQGVLPGTRTEGGHRRFRRSDVQRLARERRRPPSLRPWELSARPLRATAALLAAEGRVIVERTGRALYDPQRPGWFATPQGLSRAQAWLGPLSAALSAGAMRDALGATAAYADAATLGGASPAEVVRFLGQFGAIASHELLRGRTGADEARALQRLLNAATEAFLARL